MSAQRIGLDFDNTLVGYDHIFVEEAAARDWYPGSARATKKTVRDHLRATTADGEERWQVIQARVYGHRMADARLIDGVAEFLKACRDREVPVSIISHKTEFARRDPARVDLRRAALAWMEANGFFDDFGLSPTSVFFEPTRQAKIARIGATGCTDFVDDLEEVFREPGFPQGVRRHLFSPECAVRGPFTAYASWSEIADALL